jgi:hypothetical protein
MIRILWAALLTFASGASLAVAPPTYRLNTTAGGYVSTVDNICAIGEEDFNKVLCPKYGGNCKLTGSKWIGFRRYATDDKFAFTFDGASEPSVVCKGTYWECARGRPDGTGCGEWKVVNAVDYRTWGWGLCPKGTLFVEATQECGCPHGMDWEASVGACRPIRDKNSDRPELDVCRGNPIYPLTGAKVQSVPLLSFGGRSLGLRYSTRRALSEVGTFVSRGQVLVAPAGAGPQWSFDFERVFYYPDGSQIYLGGDQWDYFQ